MWPHGIVVPAPELLIITLASRRLRNHSRLRHSSRKRPLKLSSAPFCHGFPGSISAVWTPAISSHSRIALLTNSGPLSVSRKRGVPTFADQSGQHLDHTAQRMLPATSIASALAGEFVDHGEAFQVLAVGTGVEHEVVRPDVIRRPRPAADEAANGLPDDAGVDGEAADPPDARGDAHGDGSCDGLRGEGRSESADNRSADTAQPGVSSPPATARVALGAHRAVGQC